MSVKNEKNYFHFSVWARWLENTFHEDKLKYGLKVKHLENLAFEKFCYLNHVK